MTRQPDNYPFPSVPAPIRYTAALASIVVVFVLYRASDSMIDGGGLFLLLGIAVIGCAWFAGTGTALAATVLGAVLGSVAAGEAQSPAVEMHLALFIVQGLLLTALVSEMRRARRSAERDAALANTSQAEAEAANRTKDEFLATISHELRTPLNAVLGWLHLIRTGKLDEPTEARGFESIERNVRLQAQLTANLLDVSKALTGRLQLQIRPVSLNAIVDEAVSQVAVAASAKAVTLSVARGSGPLVVRGDANRLRQVVWHLLSNAIKFTPRDGAIDVIVESNDLACVTVRDTGPGIDPQFLPHIFERFTQADASPTRVTAGLGVGLALVRELVERHGGEIQARNRANHGGSLFVVRLPLHVEDQVSHPVAPAPARPDISSPPLDGLRVLLLDRDQDTRDLMTVVLEQHGASVRVVSAVAEALELLEAWRPDVLVSDAVSPDRDAYALTGKVHSLEADRGGRIPALALTSLARSDEETRRMLSEVQRDLPKPVEPAILTAEIARLAGRERRRAAR